MLLDLFIHNVGNFGRRVVSRLLQARDEEEAVLCLQVLESIIAYSSLPSSALSHIIYALTRLVNVPQITKLTYKVSILILVLINIPTVFTNVS